MFKVTNPRLFTAIHIPEKSFVFKIQKIRLYNTNTLILYCPIIITINDKFIVGF